MKLKFSKSLSILSTCECTGTLVVVDAQNTYQYRQSICVVSLCDTICYDAISDRRDGNSEHCSYGVCASLQFTFLLSPDSSYSMYHRLGKQIDVKATKNEHKRIFCCCEWKFCTSSAMSFGKSIGNVDIATCHFCDGFVQKKKFCSNEKAKYFYPYRMTAQSTHCVYTNTIHTTTTQS